MLALLMKILKALNSEQSPGQLAAAVSFAAIIGLTPLLSLHNFFILLITSDHLLYYSCCRYLNLMLPFSQSASTEMQHSWQLSITR